MFKWLKAIIGFMFKWIIGCSYSTIDTQRFYGVKYDHKILRIFWIKFADHWNQVGWSDGTEKTVFAKEKKQDAAVST